MKIIKYPKLPMQRCKNCKALVEIKFKDLKINGFSGAKEIWKCKLCKYDNYVKFEENSNEEDLEQELNMYKSLYIENEKVVDYQHNKLSKMDKMVDIACGKLVDFEYENKESVHSAQAWKERLEALAKQELEKENGNESICNKE